ncbi:oligosaccharide flippase family protein [Georgenia sp. SUBG003]|uniref:oligosaccharide flippase family protein n=1 Tax=Georgenia sp. SUBG003 TaxID=1497974 RepID=UPI0004D8DDDF|nr:hypothetical protein DA06_23450 [Georgenia sp. SUBG003]
MYAVALTVQTILLTLADLGLSTELIRCEDPRSRAPTLAVLGLLSGGCITAVIALAAEPIATALGSSEAGPVLRVLSLTLVLASAGVVPSAMLARRFDQKRLFLIAGADLTVNATVTISLVVAGWGPMALALGRVCGQSTTLVLQFVLSGERPRLGIDRQLVRPILAFSLPVAGANLLSWALLGIDKIVLARVGGAEALGYYVLAFTMSTWPMIAVAQTVRSVAMPAFAQVGGGTRDRTLAVAMAPTWALAVPCAGLLAVLAAPLVVVVYGPVWQPAAALLVPLAAFGGIRVGFDLLATYLLARGASVSVLVIQVGWFAALVVAMYLGATRWGAAGAATAHVVVAVVLVLPAYLWTLRRVGADLGALGRSVWQPVAAAVPAGGAAFLVARAVDGPLPALLLGGTVGGVLYLVMILRWLRRRIRRVGTERDRRALTTNPVSHRRRHTERSSR